MEAEEGEEKVTRKRTAAGQGMPAKKRLHEEGTQPLKVLLSSPSLSAEQVEEKMIAELDSIAQVCAVCVHRCRR